jgi:hypothetical protein
VGKKGIEKLYNQKDLKCSKGLLYGKRDLAV